MGAGCNAIPSKASNAFTQPDEASWLVEVDQAPIGFLALFRTSFGKGSKDGLGRRTIRIQVDELVHFRISLNQVTKVGAEELMQPWFLANPFASFFSRIFIGKKVG